MIQAMRFVSRSLLSEDVGLDPQEVANLFYLGGDLTDHNTVQGAYYTIGKLVFEAGALSKSKDTVVRDWTQCMPGTCRWLRSAKVSIVCTSVLRYPGQLARCQRRYARGGRLAGRIAAQSMVSVQR